MPIRQHIEDCTSIFDIAALLYARCSDRTHFEQLLEQLEDYEPLSRKTATVRRSILTKLQPILETASADDLCKNPCGNPVSLLAARYAEFSDWLYKRECDRDVAAWTVLEVIDRCIGPRIRDLVRLHIERTIAGLNTNYAEGLPRVIPKLPSTLWVPDDKRLTPLRDVEDSAAARLENLAFIASPQEYLQFKVDSLLWSDLDGMNLTLAVISPRMGPDDFVVQEPAKGKTSGNVFWVKATESAEYRQHVMELLRAADELGATIAVLPELSSSQALEMEVTTVASSEPFTSLRLIVLGSYHSGDEARRKTNWVSVLDRTGAVIWRQAKRTPFMHKTYGREWIETDYPQIMQISPIGGIGVLVCMDFLQDDMRRSLCQASCKWFLVPAMTKGLSATGKFSDALRHCGKWGESVVAVSNSRLGAELEAENRDLSLFYKPLQIRESSSPGEPVSDCIWLLKLARTGEDFG